MRRVQFKFNGVGEFEPIKTGVLTNFIVETLTHVEHLGKIRFRATRRPGLPWRFICATGRLRTNAKRANDDTRF